MYLSRSPRITRTALTLITGAIVGGAVTATTARAQAPRSDRARLLSLAATGGLGGVPDALASQCGNVRPSNSRVGVNGGVALLVRPGRWLVLQADARVAFSMFDDCTDLGTPVSYDYADDLERVPVGTAAARIGAETPPGLPLVRATAGVGTVWGGRSLPLAVVGLAAGTRGKGARFLVELDHYWTRVDAVERRFNTDPLGAPRLTRDVVLRPSWDVVRVGVEVPLVAAR
jgi:hypothetical protein